MDFAIREMCRHVRKALYNTHYTQGTSAKGVGYLLPLLNGMSTPELEEEVISLCARVFTNPGEVVFEAFGVLVKDQYGAKVKRVLRYCFLANVQQSPYLCAIMLELCAPVSSEYTTYAQLIANVAKA
jgi:hypothetical protein